jgi:chromosome partitioning related protein ParA
MIRFAIVSTKGGAGKTTLTAALGAVLADMGLHVLLVDADSQPSLSTYYPITLSAPWGLTQVLREGMVDDRAISKTNIDNLDVLRSDDKDNALPHWLTGRIDGPVRLRTALRSAYLAQHYDVVLIDSQGAQGILQNVAILAADQLISPLPPEALPAREFKRGLLDLLERLEPAAALGAAVGPLKVIIYRADPRSIDARTIITDVRNDYIKMSGRVTVCGTIVPATKAYKESATMRVPVHRLDGETTGRTPCAKDVLYSLVGELFPNLAGIITPEEVPA